MKSIDDTKIAYKVSVTTIIGNVVLSIVKFVAGLLSGSAALMSDAVHSLSDVFSTFIVMIGVKISSKQADEDHPYGHERMECVVSLVLGCILLLVGAFMGYDGVKQLIIGVEVKNTNLFFDILGLSAAVLSIATKEWMYQYTKKASKQINSSALLADAWHHRSDAFSSIGSVIGIAGTMMGIPILDPIACVIICMFIIKAAYDVLKDGVYRLIDHSCNEELRKEIKNTVLTYPGVLGLDTLKTRVFGSRTYADIEISVDGNLTLTEAHKIANGLHDKIESEYTDVKHCMIHVNPYEE